mgnify:CR=1 FL=1
MEDYKKFFSLENIEKKIEEYCLEYDVDDSALVNRFEVKREFEYDQFLICSKNGIIPALRNFIEFHHPIIFKIKDRERECDIIEVRITDIGWKFHCLDWRKGKPL